MTTGQRSSGLIRLHDVAALLGGVRVRHLADNRARADPTERLGAADRDDVGRVDLDHGGLVNQRHGEHQSSDTIFAEELAANARKRPVDDLDVHPLGEEGMGIVLKRGGCEPLDGVDLCVGNEIGRASCRERV